MEPADARHGTRRAQLLAILAVFCALSAYAAFAAAPPGELAVSFLDVGQGDAIYIESPDGYDLLIDGGPPDGSLLPSLSAAMGPTDRRIDVVVITHPDADHVGGLAELYERFDIGATVVSGNESDTAIWSAVREAIEREGTPVVYARAGTRIELGAVSFDVLFPDRDPAGWESNAASIVGVLSYGSTSVFLSGDAPAAVERYLVSRDRTALDVGILKLGHHGSDTSTADELLVAATPEYVVVSAGAGNRYGHPTEKVIRRVRAAGACIVRTDESGTVTFVSDGRTFRTDAPCSDARGPVPKKE